MWLLEQTRDRNLRKSNLEPLLNGLQNLLVCLRAHEGDRETLSSETTGTTNSVQVRISIAWEIIVDSQVDTLDINTTAKDIGGYTNPLIKLLKLLVALDTILFVSKWAIIGRMRTLTAPPG
jgi:hypothetical protein